MVPPVHRYPVLVAAHADVTVLLYLLVAVVTLLAQRLPVGLIQEQSMVALMRDDVVHDGSRSRSAEAFALDAERIGAQE